MKQVRRSAFETNSSSSHSITIAPGDFVPDKLYPDENGVLDIYTGEFGWEREDYYLAHAKAAYCLTWLKSTDHYRPRNPDLSPQEQMFVNVLKRVTGAIEVRFVPAFEDDGGKEWHGYKWGYIDHQSIEEGGGVLRPAWESEETLERFIFNPASRLHTDNDNDPCPECEARYGSW